jgi:hypothetical protein
MIEGLLMTVSGNLQRRTNVECGENLNRVNLPRCFHPGEQRGARGNSTQPMT